MSEFENLKTGDLVIRKNKGYDYLRYSIIEKREDGTCNHHVGIQSIERVKQIIKDKMK